MKNRTYKSSVFTMLLENPEYALDVYNALNGTNYRNKKLVKVQRLSSGILLSVHNDASFLINSILNLYEQQSTFNPNMPLRFLFYYSEMMYDYVDEIEADLYGHKRILLPTPVFVVFYNGCEERPAKDVLRLSDSFQKKMEEYGIDIWCVVYNINPGYNDNVLARSRVLQGYTTFVEKVRAYEKKKPLKEAVEQAVEDCIREGVLAEFFEGRKNEVVKRAILDFTFERRLELAARDYREDGLAEGFSKGRLCNLITQICKKHQKGFSVKETAEMLEEDEGFVQTIYALVDKCSPDYEVEKIYAEYMGQS